MQLTQIPPPNFRVKKFAYSPQGRRDRYSVFQKSALRQILATHLYLPYQTEIIKQNEQSIPHYNLPVRFHPSPFLLSLHIIAHSISLVYKNANICLLSKQNFFRSNKIRSILIFQNTPYQFTKSIYPSLHETKSHNLFNKTLRSFTS